MPATASLESLLTRAGAVMANHNGHLVAAHYGSASGELAVLVRNVGLVVRTDLDAEAIDCVGRALDAVAWDAVGGTSGLTAIEVVGRRAPELLTALGAYGAHGDPLEPAPVTIASVGDAPVIWLHRSARDALALVAPEAAGDVWRAIELEGRRFGVSCVGIEALERFVLVERAAA